MKKKGSVIKNNLYVLKIIHKASPGRIVMGLVQMLLGTVTNFLFNVYLLRLIVNSIANGTSFGDIFGYIVGVGILLMLNCLFSGYYSNIYLPVAEGRMCKYIKKMVLKKASEVDMACYETPEFYDDYMKAINETESVANNVLSSLFGWLSNILTLLSTSLMIFLIDPIFIIFCLAPVIYSLVMGKTLNRLRYRFDMEMTEKTRERDYIKRVFYLADYAKEMRLTGIANVLFGRFFKTIDELKEIIKSHGVKIAVVDYFNIVIQYVVLFIGSIVYSTYKTVVSKTMLLGDCIIVVNNIVGTASAMQGVIRGYMSLHDNSLRINNIRTFLDYEPKIRDMEYSLDIEAGAHTVSFENVCFSYGVNMPEVLKNITFNIRPGEKIALVGHNGAGKTTLVKLLLRLYDPVSGKLKLDGRDVKEYKVSSYRRLFGTVFQHFKIFSMSVMENVLLKSDISKNDRILAEYAMKSSGVYDKIKTLTHGADTVLTREFDPEGAVLSGGENQKIAIARIFAKPCDIVIMDEPSSALDPIAEYKMYEAMMEVCVDKSVVYISHRLSSAVIADRIYLLENGEIVESGTHAELLSLDGKYADMWKKQSEQYQKEGIS